MESNGEKTSRRDVLKLGAYGLGAIGAMSVASGAKAQAATKPSGHAPANAERRKAVHRLPALRGRLFRRTVDANHANGYCILFAKKPA